MFRRKAEIIMFHYTALFVSFMKPTAVWGSYYFHLMCALISHQLASNSFLDHKNSSDGPLVHVSHSVLQVRIDIVVLEARESCAYVCYIGSKGETL